MVVAELFTEWLEGRLTIISEFGGSHEYAPLVERSRQAAELLGIEWSEDLIPWHVREIISWAEEDD